MREEVVKAKLIRPQYWRVTLECGHRQEVHSVREGGPAYVKYCRTCFMPSGVMLRKDGTTTGETVRIFEYVRNGHRFGLTLTEDAAKAQIGTDALPLYEIRPVDLSVVFLIAHQDDECERQIDEHVAYSTLAAAEAAQDVGDAIVVVELK